MPELAEVKVVIKALKSKILNKTIKEFIVVKPKILKENSIEDFKKALINNRIIDIVNKGKYIIFQLDSDDIVISHLRMEGKYRFFDVPVVNHKHMMLKFIFEDKSELQYLDSRMFGTYHLRNKSNYLTTEPLLNIALEPLDTDIDSVYNKFAKLSTPIKTKLLDQSLIAGIGNIYADEALFASKIHPLTPCKNLSKEQLSEIIKNAGLIMQASFEKGGTTLFSYESLNNQEGEFQNFLQIHHDKIKNCKLCNHSTTKIKVNQRGTYFCSNCQKMY
ncbi:Foramidopyrimidine-DNA glycosylase [Metamycoplasma cloacale]|uniref:DNA-formamidopyrimidine glycosylase n=1 Tax=Metamycoplasma cloacale TaxID=92401 RepID=A0A2Z4LLC5_9BACT|nr:DNA-formamidopyrimidine glycosylase [Metamycoplasma cloacale]AWX42503.1 DNA-formamidopyrimidine glycosylase [Metamycoplasma cloacale]VEU79151.1 Foramidopyrimidine-DNA glycosylase [Metamycoplasma cloacale]